SQGSGIRNQESGIRGQESVSRDEERLAQRFNDAAAAVAAAEGVFRGGAGSVAVLDVGVLQSGSQMFGAVADKLRNAGGDGFRAFGVFTEHEERFAQGRRLFLNPTGVRDDEPRVGQETDKVEIILWLQQLDAR